MRRVQNLQSYALDTPTSLAPGAIADVEDSPDIDRLIDAGILGEVEQTSGKKKAQD